MWNNFINFIYANLFLFQFISLFLSGIMLFLVIYMTVSLNLVGEKVEHWVDVWNFKRISKRRAFRAWRQIQKRLKIGGETQLKLAVLEASRILDDILKTAGYPGSNLDERLESITPAQFSNIEELRQVQKIRNRIVSEPDFSLTPEETEIAINIYKRTFVYLGLIEESD